MYIYIYTYDIHDISHTYIYIYRWYTWYLYMTYMIYVYDIQDIYMIYIYISHMYTYNIWYIYIYIQYMIYDMTHTHIYIYKMIYVINYKNLTGARRMASSTGYPDPLKLSLGETQNKWRNDLQTWRWHVFSQLHVSLRGGGVAASCYVQCWHPRQIGLCCAALRTPMNQLFDLQNDHWCDIAGEICRKSVYTKHRVFLMNPMKWLLKVSDLVNTNHVYSPL